VARAKRTERADARRRYRAEQAARADLDDESAEVESADAPEPKARAARRPAARRTSSTPGQRPGILDALRSSVQPANIRDDVRAAPDVLRRTPLLWIPFGLVIVSGILAFIPGLAAYTIPAFLIQTFLIPPPLIGPFIAGLVAPRGGWLFGLLMGILGGIVFSLFVATTPGSSVGAATITPDIRLGYIGYSLVTSPTFGVLVGAFAAFYRRFLRSTTPARPTASKGRRSNARPRR
jgi:hypothetical protein